MKGQIVKIVSNLCSVECEDQVFECTPRGKFRNQKISPVVGDYVEFDEENKYLLEILPRKNYLERPLVANIDQGLLVTSVKSPDFSTNLLDKLLTVMEYHQITPIICITKWDLLTGKEKKEIKKILKYYQKIGYKVIYNHKLWQVKKIFKNKTTVLTGQTGAGKSTLINKLDPHFHLETGEISKALGRGKHTTRHVELLHLCKGKVLDTPGFSQLDFQEVPDEELRNTFIEFQKYPCPYKDCMHLSEKECQVKANVKNGKILASRYENYQKLMKKSRW